MGVPSTPHEAAPAYDDVFRDHPVNLQAAPGSASAYAAVAQDDDVELGTHVHGQASSSSSAPEPGSVAQTIAGVFKPKPHVHCEQCDVQTAARQRRENEQHCCSMVAVTFMVGFACAFVFSIIAMSIVFKHRKHNG